MTKLIINSLLDTDFYKVTMSCCVYNQIKPCSVEYDFKCRNPGIDLIPFKDEIESKIDHLCTLRFQPDEIDYLRGIKFIDSAFLDVLRLIQLNRDHVFIHEQDGLLKISIKGPWLLAIWFEVPVLAIVNEVYFRNIDPDPDMHGAMERLRNKIDLVKEINENENVISSFKFADFGTRRDSHSGGKIAL